MSIPEFVYVLPKDENPVLGSDDDAPSTTAAATNPRVLRRDGSSDSLHTHWSRWDSSDGAVCESMPRANTRNYQCDSSHRSVARPLNTSSLPPETNIRLQPEQTNQKLVACKRVMSKARSLSPSPPCSSKDKLKQNGPPRIPQRILSSHRSCVPPKLPVRRSSDVNSDSTSDRDCGGSRDDGDQHHDDNDSASQEGHTTPRSRTF